MSNIAVPSNSDQTPNIFQAPTFVTSEVPTSSKLNAFGQFANSQFGVLSEAVGNPFIHGIPNMGGAIGNLALLTQPVVNSDNLIAQAPPMFTSQLTVNSMQATVGSISVDGTYPITLVSGSIGTNNIIANLDSSFSIVNVAIVTKDGSGNINQVFPGTFIPNVGYTTGTITQFRASFGDVIVPGNNFYVVVVNYSIADVLSRVAINQGNVNFGRMSGYINTSDNIVTIPGSFSPTITAEINANENKTFAVRWHAKLTKNTATSTDATNYYWNATGTTSVWQSGSIPGGGGSGQVSQYISTLGTALVIPATNTPAGSTYASINGATLLAGAGTPVVPGLSYDGTTLIISIAKTAITNVSGTSTIDVYLPAQVPYRLLGSQSIAYQDLGSRVADLFQYVIGQQYGWTQSAYPNTIANRLDTDENAINLLSASVNSLGNVVVPNGSFETTSSGTGINIAPDQWTIATTQLASFQVDTATSVHGSKALKVSTGNNGGLSGSITATTASLIPISPNDNYYFKFKVQSTAATLGGGVYVNFYDIAHSFIGPQKLVWQPVAGTWPATFATYYGVIQSQTGTLVADSTHSMPTIPATARWMQLVFVAGTNGAATVNQTIYWDEINFFTPSRDGKITFYTGAVNSNTAFNYRTGPATISLLLDLIGGGGGAGDDGVGGGSGGGGGAGHNRIIVSVNPDTQYACQVGGGGLGAPNLTAGNGNAGGPSFFDTYSVGAGAGGVGGNSGGTGGAGGSASGANYATGILFGNGGNAGGTRVGAASGAGGAAGVANPLGYTFTSVGGTVPGGSGTGIGAGGGGANGATGGGNGSAGLIVIQS